MNYTDNLQDELGSKSEQSQINGDDQKKSEGKLGDLPKSETQGSDTDEDNDGMPSIEHEEIDREEDDVRNLSTVKRSYWNSLTFDYDDYLGGLKPA